MHFPYEKFNRNSYETLKGSFSGFGLLALVPLVAALDCAGLALVPLGSRVADDEAQIKIKSWV